MNKTNDKIILFTCLNLWGTLLVIIGHSGFSEDYITNTFGSIHRWIYSFHMPLFFFISGLLFQYTIRNKKLENTFIFLKKKFIKLIIPYLTLGTLLFIIKKLFSQYSQSNSDFSFLSYLLMFISPQSPGNPLGYLWFLLTLFLIFTLQISLFNFLSRLSIQFLIFSIIICTFLSLITDKYVLIFNLSKVIYYNIFFNFGMLFLDKLLEEDKNKYNGILILLFFLLSTIIFNINTNQFISLIVSPLLGIYISILICKQLINNRLIVSICKFTSKYSYSIYLLHWFTQYFVKIIMENVFHFKSIALFPLMIIFGIMGPIGICLLYDSLRLENTKIYQLTKIIIGR